MENHIIINLEAPLMAFGGPSMDRYSLTETFPGLSLITGMLGNALGYRREEHEKLHRLQDRIVMAARIDQHPPGRAPMTDFQTVALGPGVDHYREGGGWVVGWTTRGGPETRSGSASTYEQGPQQRWRDYQTDTKATVAIRLREPRYHPQPSDEAGGDPDLHRLANALDHPARPLYIGRKPCVPSTRLLAGFAVAATPLEALLEWPMEDNPGYLPPRVPLQWNPEDQPETPQGVKVRVTREVHDLMNWRARVHAGGRALTEGTLQRNLFQRSE